jgi:hypothetical protein
MSAQAAEVKKNDAKKVDIRTTSQAVTRWLLRVLGAGMAIALGIWLTYRTVEPRINASPHYNLDPRSITVTPQPAWIHSDVKGEVLRDGSLDHALNLLDESLLERVAKAFALHPWVAQVTSVRKRAGPELEVQLVYRRPACMVEVPGGLYPVDAEGVLLPTADFSSEDASHYPRLTGIQTVTEGPVGTRWQDACVLGAAQIATVLADDWTKLGLAQISPLSNPPPGTTGATAFVLYTHQGAPIIWGAAGSNRDFEPGTDERLVRLKKIAVSLHARNGSSPPIDLRTP